MTARTTPLIVLHETVVGESAALELFRRRNADDGQQASDHVLIGADGRCIRAVDEARRAFGAGDSAFQGQSVQLRPGLCGPRPTTSPGMSAWSHPATAPMARLGDIPVTPPRKCPSLATRIPLWQARYGIPASRAVTHREADRSGTRRDPHSFGGARLGRDLREQWIACGGSAQLADLGR